jgi:hypothetical protein
MRTPSTFSGLTLIHPLLIVLPCATVAAAAADVSDIELRRLFNPTASELVAEAKGGIYIYEGLRDTDIQRAMDEQFDRVENMMFIRIIKTDESGQVQRNPDTGVVVTTNDGC